MPRFFVDVSGTAGDILPVEGRDAHHITRSLRMSVGDPITICDGRGTDYRCVIIGISRELVEARVIEVLASENEPDVAVTLFMSLTKGEKMDFAIQKSVELGVRTIVPVLSGRCVVRPDGRSAGNRLERWNKIALEASKQSCRGYVPKVTEIVGYDRAIMMASEYSLKMIAYERSIFPVGELLSSAAYSDAAVFTGPEGGYEEEEIEAAEKMGIVPVLLGKRILRAETAPLCILSIIHYQAELNAGKGYGNGKKEKDISL